jgi:glycosyltransferase involved in cell wall biosynthesis
LQYLADENGAGQRGPHVGRYSLKYLDWIGLGKKRTPRMKLGADRHLLVSRAFDRDYYLSRYPDVAKSRIAPLDHYLEFGWREGRDPSPWFSTLGYLQANADIATRAINPFIHYVLWGKAEGRAPAPDRDFGTPWLDDMIRYPERQVSPASAGYDPRCLEIHWVVADFSPHSGGHLNIFRMIHWLESFGHVCKIWINRPSIHKNTRHARVDIGNMFLPLRAQIGFLQDGFLEAQGDAIFATSWETVWPVTHATGFKERFYFVQDYEPSFYPVGSQSVAAEASYSRDLACICGGPWLKQIMQTRFKRWARSYWFAFDPQTYNVKSGKRGGAVPRIAVYSRQLTSRRLVELIMSALTELVRRKVVFHADLFGSHSAFPAMNFSFTNHGVLDEERLAGLYNDCDLGISLSATNYSLVDMEMMACGLPVIEFDGENTRAVFPRGVITLAKPDPALLADAIEKLIGDPAARRSQATRALKWVRQFSWEKSARTVERAITGRLNRHAAWKARQSQPRSNNYNGEGRPSPALAGALGPIVFVGQPEYFRSAYFDGVHGGGHFEFAIDSANPAKRLQALPEFVRGSGARTCIVFRPEWLAKCDGLTEELRIRAIRVIGFSSEPVPTGNKPAHPDQNYRLEQLRHALPLPLDLLVHYDPGSADVLRKAGFERLVCHPLPVSRELFFPEKVPVEFDACFLGRSTPHRERLLSALKREARIVHVAHGLVDEQARGLMNRSRAVLNLHCEPYLNFETRAVQALRCGRPLISERLGGPWFTPGQDYQLAETPEEFLDAVRRIPTDPEKEKTLPDLSEFTLDSLLAKITDWL